MVSFIIFSGLTFHHHSEEVTLLQYNLRRTVSLEGVQTVCSSSSVPEHTFANKVRTSRLELISCFFCFIYISSTSNYIKLQSRKYMRFLLLLINVDCIIYVSMLLPFFTPWLHLL